MPVKKKSVIPVIRVRKGATKREMYAAIRKAFTADDLQKFTEIEPGIPVDDVLAEMEGMVRSSKKRSKSSS